MSAVRAAGYPVARHRWVRPTADAGAAGAEQKARWAWCGGCMDHLAQLAQFTTADAHTLLPRWQATLRAEAKRPGTIDTYTHGLRSYLTWCARSGLPPLVRATMTAWMSDMLDTGAASGSARIRQPAVRRFVAWLIATGHVPADPFAGVKGPKQTQRLVSPLTDDDLCA